MILSGQIYTCSAGETFDSVALSIYGEEKYSCEILCANPALCHLPMFEGGEELQLPIVEIVDDTEENEPTVPTAPWKEA